MVQAGEEKLLDTARDDLFEGREAKVATAIRTALLDDINTPKAIAVLSEPLKIMNELLVVRKKKKVSMGCAFCMVTRNLLRHLSSWLCHCARAMRSALFTTVVLVWRVALNCSEM